MEPPWIHKPGQRCLRCRLDQLENVVADAVDARADDPQGQRRFRPGAQQTLDLGFAGQVRIESFRETVFGDGDRGAVMDVAKRPGLLTMSSHCWV